MGQSLRLLLLEDSEEDEWLILRELRKGGFDVRHRRVASEQALREALYDEPWDVLIADYSLPQFDGMAAVALVRAEGLELPVLFVSGAIEEAQGIEAMRAGVKDYISKDKLARLPVAIQRELDNAKAQRKAARQIAQARRYAEDIVSSVRLPLVIVDHGLRIVSSNPAFQQTFGVGAEDSDDDYLFDRLGIAAPDSPRTRRLQAALEASGEISAEELQLSVDGRDRAFLLGSQRIRLAGRKSTHLLVSLQDVTDYKLLERKMNAAQRMESVGLLAGGVAHDFNNVLTVIDNYAYFLSDVVRDNEAGLRDLQMIQDAANRAARLTQQLLAFSRKQTQDLRSVHLNDVVMEVTKLLGRVLGEHIELETLLSDDVVAINADITQLEQIIMNLAVNARDAMPDGGHLCIETGRAQLDEAYAEAKGVELPHHDFVVLIVSDNGVGMDQQTLSRVFEPFFTTKGADRGTGLGLATVYGIVKQCDGYVWIYSEHGRGTAVKVYLPIPNALAPSRGSCEEDSMSQLRGEGSVLLVEDDDGVRRAASRILRSAGYDVLEATNGLNGLRTLGTSHVDLVLTDVVMPAMTGPVLGKQAAKRHPHVPVVYMSGYTDAMIDRIESLPEGAPYLQKPFTRQSLLRMVQAVLLGNLQRAS